MSNGTKNGQIPVWRLAQAMRADSGQDVKYEEPAEGTWLIPVVSMRRLKQHDPVVSEAASEWAEFYWPRVAAEFIPT